MRRTDREITDPVRIGEIISECTCCRLGLRDGESVYVVPLNFGHVERSGRRILYFHGAAEGRKLDLIRKNGYAGFEMDAGHQIRGHGDVGCSYTAAFRSVIGEGAISVVESEEEKREGLAAILCQSTGRTAWTFDSKMLESTCVLRLDVESLSCKEHL